MLVLEEEICRSEMILQPPKNSPQNAPLLCLGWLSLFSKWLVVHQVFCDYLLPVVCDGEVFFKVILPSDRTFNISLFAMLPTLEKFLGHILSKVQ